MSDHAFTGSYQSVKRFAHKFAASIDPPFRRIERAPGEEMQVDFGSAAWVAEAGRRRRPHLFRCVLSHSQEGLHRGGVAPVDGDLPAVHGERVPAFRRGDRPAS